MQKAMMMAMSEGEMERLLDNHAAKVGVPAVICNSPVHSVNQEAAETK